MIVGTEPIFTVADVQRAVNHYQRLGFSTSLHDETYAFAHRDGLTIHLAHRDDPATEGPGALYLHVDDADQLAGEWRRAGYRWPGRKSSTTASARARTLTRTATDQVRVSLPQRSPGESPRG